VTRLVFLTPDSDDESLSHFLFTEKPFILEVKEHTISYP